MKLFKAIYDKSFPVVRVKKRYRNRLPWLTTEIKESIKHKNKLYKISLKHPTAYNETKYKHFKNMITRLLRWKEKEYYQSQILLNKSNLRKTWIIIKDAINKKKLANCSDKFCFNGGITSDPTIISNAFNNYFVNIGPTLSSKIPDQGSQFKVYMPPRNKFSMFLRPVKQDEVKKIIVELKDGAAGEDGITSVGLKCVVDYIAEPLTHMANMSFSQGVFPNEMKKAMVSPLYKAKDPMSFSNYRPISLLSTFSKVLEKLMYKRLLDFLNKFKILNKFQFGFRNNHSTYMALIVLLENLLNALEKGESAVGIFLDFQKAFDTVNHEILLEKLEIYGIRGLALSWFASYLTNRSQCVIYNGCESNHRCIKCGVPQGSILGPLLFLIYINDLPSVSKLFMPILFADDTNLFCTNRNLTTLFDDINRELVNIFAWVNSNKLSLNIDKTNYMLFTPKCTTRPEKNIAINGKNILEVDETKFLGVIIDNKFKWSAHINYISTKISKGIGILIKVRKIFDESTLLSLYNSLILPYISYCIQVWGSAYETHLRHLMTLQNKIVRIISGVPPRTNTDMLYEKLDILSVKRLFTYNVAMFMYKYDNDMLPELFTNSFTPVSSIHPHETRQATSDHLYIMFQGSNRGQKQLKYIGPHLWNYLIENMNPNCSIGLFKKSLRNLLLTSSFSDVIF